MDSFADDMTRLVKNASESTYDVLPEDGSSLARKPIPTSQSYQSLVSQQESSNL